MLARPIQANRVSPQDAAANNEASRNLTEAPLPVQRKNKMVAALLAFFFGGVGVHKFYLNYSKQGTTMLLTWLSGWVLMFLSIFTMPAIAVLGSVCLLCMPVVALIEGIIYLTKSDEGFHETYVLNRRGWL